MGRTALALVVLVVAARAAGADIDLKASVDRSTVGLGEPVVVTVTVAGTQNAPAPDLGDASGFQAQYLGPSTQISIVNGRMSASVSHSFRLTAQKTGTLRIGPITLDYEGKRYSAGEIRIAVSADAPRAAGAPGSGDLRLLLSAAKGEIYVGEKVALEVKLLVGNARVDNLQFPQLVADGALTEKLPQPGRSEEIVDGRRFQVLTFPTTLTALRPGEIRLTATMGMSVVVPRRRRGIDPFFDGFFGGGEQRPVTVKAEALALTALELPDEGRPDGFGGAVGQFDFSLEAAPTELTAGDPITVRMRIEGSGNLDRVTAPTIPVDDDRFRAYDPVVVKEKEEESRVFEQVVIPRDAAVSALPAVSFSFFDPVTGRYRTITRGPIPLDVQAAAAEEAPKIVGAEGSRPAPRPETLGRDIVYIKDVPGALQPRGERFYRRAWFAAVQIVAPLAFFAVSFAFQRRERLAADPRLLRLRQAGREVRRALADLERREVDAAFYDRLGGAVQAYLGAKLDLPPGAVERQRVLDRLDRNGSAAATREHVDAFFALVEQARYAPVAGDSPARETALRLASQIVDQLERRRGLGARAAALIAILGLGAVTVRVAAAPVEGQPFQPYAAFFRANAAYQEGRYDEAARAYESVLAAGLESGPLYFNLGNAELKSGRLGNAILHYERARRMLPRDPDVRANLRYARDQAGVEAVERALWERVLFPLAPRLSTAELAAAVSAFWFLFWGALLAGRTAARLRTATARAAWAAGAVLLVLAANLAARGWEVELTRAAVVTAAGESAVRFEPSASGTEHFRAREGDLLAVDGERDGWYRVERHDGRRGWLPAAAVGLVG